MIEQELPPKYYLSYFNYLIDFVLEKYNSIINKREKEFIKKFYALPEDSQLLYLRFANRKSWFFKTDKLSYQEISNITKALKILEKKGFIESINPKKHEILFNEILNTLTKSEILALDKCLGKSNLKEKLIEELISKNKHRNYLEKIKKNLSLIKVNYDIEITFLKFLFFGNRYMDMNEFVVRDLGLVNYYNSNEEQMVARFNNRKDAEDKWFITDQNELFKEFKTRLSVSEIYDWFLNVLTQCNNLSDIAKPALKHLSISVGRFFEQKKAYEYAIEIYQKFEEAPSRERRVRCYLKLKDKELASQLCQLILENPQNEQERTFALDQIRMFEGKKLKSTTEYLKKSDSIELDEIYRRQVELGAIEHFMEEEKEAYFSENLPWRGLFGLVFWEIIFDPQLIAFHHPFQRRPSDLHLPDFYEKRKSAIENQLNSLKTTDDLIEKVQNNYLKNFGIANVFVVWEEEILHIIKAIITKLELDQIKSVLETMAKNIVENSRGFPDILVWDSDWYSFYEIKSPTDNLSNQQLFWLEFFKNININSQVLRIEFNKKLTSENLIQ